MIIEKVGGESTKEQQKVAQKFHEELEKLLAKKPYHTRFAVYVIDQVNMPVEGDTVTVDKLVAEFKKVK
jgi:hypothetical protein